MPEDSGFRTAACLDDMVSSEMFIRRVVTASLLASRKWLVYKVDDDVTIL